MLFTRCAYALVATLASAAAIESTTISHNWRRGSTIPPDHAIKLHIALQPAYEDAAVESLLRISDPTSGHYRRHLSVKEVHELSAPSQESVSTVEKWLREHDMWESSVVRAGIVEIDTTIGHAEKLLDTTYHYWSTDAGREDAPLIRTESYTLPEDVAEIVDFVTPTTSFPLLNSNTIHHSGTQQPLNKRKRDTCASGDETTPTCIRQIYGIDYTAQPDRTRFAVYGTEAASYNPADLQAFLSKYNPPAAAASTTFTVIGSGDSSSNASLSSIESKFETSLVTQVSLGLAFPASGILYNNGGVFGPNPGKTYDRFVSFLQDLLTNSTDSLPSVVSFSESLAESQLDPAYARRACNMMAQIGARGISLLFSAGNNGAQGNPNSPEILQTKFPASCPWVTSVGGTTNLGAETAATQSTLDTFTKSFYTASGGGFSNLFPRPNYQSYAVPNYIKTQVPTTYYNISGFNASGRGVPDLAAFSTNYPTFVSFVPGMPVMVAIGGTSSATPLWAAVIALLNDYEASRGRPTLGFLNPWLYSLRSGEGIKDIVTGGSNGGKCGGFLGGDCPVGYNVTSGWDPVTGLGSPLWKGLVKALDERCDRRNFWKTVRWQMGKSGL
jgi:tripeptidyl-peptidase-1